MEIVVKKGSLANFRNRENPWKNASYLERLGAMVEICEPNQNMETLNQDFLEYIGLLENHGVDYLQ